ncbi:MAG: hypothetical protein L3J73_01500, partial [Thermoplasmata archaeon]|nr:hypothetical protein [Thermoplasmata archaeon]
MSGRRRRALALRPALGSALLLAVLVTGVFAVPTGARASGSGGGAAVPGVAHPAVLCSGATTPTSFLGSLVVQGGGSPGPSVANRTIQLSYWADLNFTPTNGSSILSCDAETAFAVTDPLGGFALSAPVPTSTCNKFSCSIFSGPFGPLVFSERNGTPPGFFATQSVNGGQVTLAFV